MRHAPEKQTVRLAFVLPLCLVSCTPVQKVAVPREAPESLLAEAESQLAVVEKRKVELLHELIVLQKRYRAQRQQAAGLEIEVGQLEKALDHEREALQDQQQQYGARIEREKALRQEKETQWALLEREYHQLKDKVARLREAGDSKELSQGPRQFGARQFPAACPLDQDHRLRPLQRRKRQTHDSRGIAAIPIT